MTIAITWLETTETFDKSAEKAPRVNARKKHAASAPDSWVLSVVVNSTLVKNETFCIEIELVSNIVVIITLSTSDYWY